MLIYYHIQSGSPNFNSSPFGELRPNKALNSEKPGPNSEEEIWAIAFCESRSFLFFVFKHINFVFSEYLPGVG